MSIDLEGLLQVETEKVDAATEDREHHEQPKHYRCRRSELRVGCGLFHSFPLDLKATRLDQKETGM
jgi:hypothetical protein